MSTPLRVTGRRLKSFRLGDVPAPLRERAKSVAIKQTTDLVERIALGIAADQPSDKVYVISQTAWDRVVGGYERRVAARAAAR